MDGVELVAAIRALESEEGLARTPVVALAANVMEGEREHCVWAGMDDFIGKPTTIPFLASKLRRWLPQLASPHGEPLVPAPAPASATDGVLEWPR